MWSFLLSKQKKRKPQRARRLFGMNPGSGTATATSSKGSKSAASNRKGQGPPPKPVVNNITMNVTEKAPAEKGTDRPFSSDEEDYSPSPHELKLNLDGIVFQMIQEVENNLQLATRKQGVGTWALNDLDLRMEECIKDDYIDCGDSGSGSAGDGPAPLSPGTRRRRKKLIMREIECKTRDLDIANRELSAKNNLIRLKNELLLFSIQEKRLEMDRLHWEIKELRESLQSQIDTHLHGRHCCGRAPTKKKKKAAKAASCCKH